MSSAPPARPQLLRETAAAAAVLLALVIWCRPLQNLSEYTTTPLIDPAGVLQVYPWVHYNADQYGKGHFPLWDPYTALGQPHLANIQTGALFPPWAAWSALGGDEWGWGALLIGRLWLAGLFWFVFARTRLCSFGGALVTAAAYAAGGYSLWFIELVDLNSQMFLPLLLIALPGLIEKPRLGRMLGAAVLVALAILGGHPEAAFITVFVAVLYTGAGITINFTQRHRNTEKEKREKKDLKYFLSFSVSLCLCVKYLFRLTPKTLVLAAAGIIGVLLTFATLLPFLNYLPRCWTMHGPGFGFFHLDPRALFNLILPGIHVLFTDMPKEIPVQYINYGARAMLALPFSATAVPGNFPGAGILVAGLALAAVIKARRGPWPVLFFIGLLAAALGLTLGLPGFRLIALIPPFSLNSNFKFFFSEIHAALAALAGVGFDVLAREGKRHRIAGTALAGGIIGIALMFAPDTGLLEYILPNYDMRFPLVLKINALGFILASLGLALLYIPLTPHLRKILPLIIVAAFLKFNSIYVTPFVTLAPPPDPATEPPEFQAAVARLGPEIRTTGLDGFWPANMLLTRGRKDVRSSDALFYQPYINLLNRVNDVTAQNSLNFFYPSYFTRPASGSLTTDRARDLAVGLIASETPWRPHEIIDQVILKGRSIDQVARPARLTFPDPRAEMGEEFPGQPGLFLHAPGRVRFIPHDVSVPQQESTAALGTLSFVPAYLSWWTAGDHAGHWFTTGPMDADGAVHQVTVRENARVRLAYSRCHHPYLGPNHRLSAAPITITAPARAEVELSTLPGPLDYLTNDWSGFAALSWDPGPYEPPPRPVWSGGPLGPYLYESPHWPWAHAAGREDPLATARTAGDQVTVEVADIGGEQLVVHEAWYPGWRVEIDGTPGTIEIPADRVSWRAPVPEGAKRAVFFYTPADFRVGLWVTLATLLFGTGVWLGKRAGSLLSRHSSG